MRLSQVPFSQLGIGASQQKMDLPPRGADPLRSQRLLALRRGQGEIALLKSQASQLIMAIARFGIQLQHTRDLARAFLISAEREEKPAIGRMRLRIRLAPGSLQLNCLSVDLDRCL